MLTIRGDYLSRNVMFLYKELITNAKPYWNSLDPLINFQKDGLFQYSFFLNPFFIQKQDILVILSNSTTHFPCFTLT